MKKNAKIIFRDGDNYLTQIDNTDAPKTLASRMTTINGGYLICREDRWGTSRTLIINLKDVKCIEITENKNT